jgi:hypothetical protein
LMIGFIRAVGAVALFVAMGLVSLVYADTFSPAAASAGETVTLTLEETVDWSPQLGGAYFLCDSGCGKTLLGAVKQSANMQFLNMPSFRKQYELTFNIPANAKPGNAYLEIGCDDCFKNYKNKRKPTSQWRKVTGLQVLPPATSRQDIITSYKFAFGRDPQEGEILFWQKQVKLSVAQLVANHRNYIKQDVATCVDIIKRSFHEILKYEPSGMELHDWSNRLQKSGETYAELVDAHRKLMAQTPQQPSYADTFSPAAAFPRWTVTLAGQAKPNTTMSGYFSCNSGCGQTHIGAATVNAQGWYSLTFKIPADAKPGGAFVTIGCDGCGNNWRSVTGLQVHGALSPSPAPPPRAEPVKPSNPPFPNGKKERCFGAVGIGCDGDGAQGWVVPQARAIGDGNYRQWVNVGSIAHDSCCAKNPNGAHCSSDDPSDGGDDRACAIEWRKAVYNWRDKRSWEQDFGSYKSSEDSDDPTPQHARSMKLSDFFGNYKYEYQWGEYASTRKLCAPEKTNLDSSDEQFCCSQSFKKTFWAVGVSNWGVCR